MLSCDVILEVYRDDQQGVRICGSSRGIARERRRRVGILYGVILRHASICIASTQGRRRKVCLRMSAGL